MSDKPEDRPEERRRTGPLGGDAGSEETRREPAGGSDAEPTRQAPAQRPEPAEDTSRETERAPQRPSGEAEDKETRVIRTPPGYGTAAQDSGTYPRGYFEAAEEREDRLRDMYGGVDWLASFLGFVFAAVIGALFALIAGLVLAPLGFSLNLGGEIGAAVITGLVLVAVLIFLTYFFGGYVAGRLARFDGGRNGAMLVLWTLAVALLAALVGGIFSNFLPVGISGGLRNFIQNDVLPAIGNLSQFGIIGVVIFVGALVVALLGGFLGGRLGSRYHAEIDRTT
jgi:membrane protease YdiL (CAAX protease family)